MPKGQAISDLEIFRRIGERLFPGHFREGVTEMSEARIEA